MNNKNNINIILLDKLIQINASKIYFLPMYETMDFMC